MNNRPPVTCMFPSRRVASGRFARLAAAVLLLGLLTACGTVTPTPSSSVAPPTASASAAPGPPQDLAGLLVADGGPLRVTTAAGDLEPFDARRDQALTVTAGGAEIVVVDGELLAWHAPDPGAGLRDWQRLVLATDGAASRPLIALAPQGGSLAAVTGTPEGQLLDVALLDVRRATARSIRVEGGVNGPPLWLGPATVAINVIGADRHSGFVTVDPVTGQVSDIPSFGFTMSASADGSLVALDDSASGDVLVGARSDMTADGIARFTRIPGPAGFAPADVALSGNGTRLAILGRSDSTTSLELLGLVDGAWRSGRTLTFDGVAVVSIAWLR